MSLIKKITEKEYPDIFKDILDFQVEEIYHEHRRGSNYFTKVVVEINQDNAPNNPELHGFWRTDVFVNDHDYGTEDSIDVLYRVEQVEITETVTKKVWDDVI